eukprot:TRINITY_DN4221_c0_g1_i1.p1 TRINITY_DN4221_c0_g1~~TRINITY_DN4221_c0_g1_i1.p1  ORF type:complete len:277 (-),score=60.93 TRINITY_DN4221_c0_g1_i1:883-1692(-)
MSAVSLETYGTPKQFVANNPTMLLKKDKFGFSLLHYFSSAGNVSDVQKLASYLVQVFGSQCLNIQDNNLLTPLHWALKRGHFGVVKSLVGCGANVNCSDKDGQTPLHLALSLFNENKSSEVVEIINFLLQHGADVNRENCDGVTSLMMASELGDDILVQTLVENYGASLEAVDNDGENALFYAVREGRENVVRLLVEKYRINVNHSNEVGETIKDFVESVGDECMAKLISDILCPFEHNESSMMELDDSLTLRLNDSGARVSWDKCSYY